ncbi:RagB/SusD family nutrient uptake outer membrane protein [Desertivirga arenae]|uniref:RagB/SusD family nutrient uptake outer membrane protein n=1 Tax=Desertivirga arenae TaxID=2810309 RepID=UPI001A979036|nr:RagB/SusD family nutrient uptake outer membrane protein [Pedobacter sp. SYSU D00823]
MNKSIINRTGFVALLAFLFIGCKDLDLTPENVYTDLTYWKTTDQANGMLNTAYSQMFSSDYFFYNEAMSDNAYSGRGDQAGSTSLASGAYDPSLPRLRNEWNDCYRGIKTCNVFLDNVDRVPNMDEALRTRMKAEARFLRAFQYFRLMTWFGDVPLIKKDLSIVDAQNISRSPREEVLSFIVAELNEVTGSLPVNTEYGTKDKGRITKGAAIALKARVMLYEGNWQEVVNACSLLMDNTSNGTYGLFNSYEGLFLPQNENNNEVILDMQYVPLLRTWSNFFDLAPLSTGARVNVMAPTQELVDSYLTLNGKKIGESGSGYDENNPYINRDPRLTYTVVYHGYQWKEASGNAKTIYIRPGTDPDKDNKPDEYAPGSSKTPTGYYIRKYYDPTHAAGFASGLNLILIRYADVLLMYAEAKNELAKLDEATWNKTIKPLRVRAGFTDAAALNYNSAATQEQFREIIRNERRTELALEGLRIFDIRRWRIAETVLNGWAHGAKFGPANEDNGYIRVNLRSFDKSKHYLWPVPREERNLNPNLSQNPNW